MHTRKVQKGPCEWWLDNNKERTVTKTVVTKEAYKHTQGTAMENINKNHISSLRGSLIPADISMYIMLSENSLFYF